MANGFVTAGGGGGGAVILRVIGQSGTAVTATLGSKSRAGSIGADGVLEIKLPSLGLWKVATTVSGSKYEQDVKVYRYGITECFGLVKKAISQCTYDEINLIIKSGFYKTFWALGDKMAPISVGGETIQFQIVGFDLDTNGKKKVPVSLISADCLKEIKYGGTNWGSSALRTATLPALKENLPKDFSKMICPVVKDYTISNLEQAFTSVDELWIPSSGEMDATQIEAGGSFTYPIFSDNAARVKKANGVAVLWTLRSAGAYHGTSQNYFVAESGAVRYSTGVITTGNVAVGCCLDTTL